MNTILKKAIKKLYKTGFYHSFGHGENWIYFKNVVNVQFSFTIENYPFKNCGTFAAGYVHQWTERGLTFESDYKTLGDIERAIFKPFYIQNTDNPDFILRAANTITLN